MFGCFAVGPFMSFFSVELLLPSWERLCNFVALSNEIRARPMLEKKIILLWLPCEAYWEPEIIRKLWSETFLF